MISKRNRAATGRATAFLLAFIMILCAAAPAQTQPSYAASHRKTPRLSNKSLNLQSGSQAGLRVKNAGRKVRWISGDKSVVRVVKKTGKYGQTAVLKAGDKTGSCIVKARIGKKTLKCRVKVKASGKVKPMPEYPGNEEDRGIEIRDLSTDAVDLASDNVYSPEKESDIPDEFADAAAEFSVRMLKETIKEEKNKSANVLVSPDSVLTALAMTENGAAGNTLKEMENVMNGGTVASLASDAYNRYLSILHSRLGAAEKPIYSCANSIWVRRNEFKPAKNFIEINKMLHNAAIYEAAFDDQTVSDINNWVYNNTRNMIDGIIDRLGPQDRIVLANAIAFEGRWAEQFEDCQVDKNGEFINFDGSKASVNMLNGMLDGNGSYLEIKGAKAFRKMYESKGCDGPVLAFEGILPPEGKSPEEFLAGLSGKDFTDAWRNAQNRKVRIRIPEFSYDYSISMKSVLKNMGIKDAFSSSAADFSAMSESSRKEVYIDEVLHKTHIELDKNGTKAAAVTAMIGKATSAFDPELPEEVYLDRPFIYAITDCTTGIPLFIGIVRKLK